MALTIHQRISRAEEEFIQATQQGAAGLTTFYHDLWEPLANEIQSCETVKEETLELWDATASRIALLTEYLLQVNVEVSKVKDEVHSELDAVFADFDLKASTLPAEILPSEDTTNTLPKYVEMAYTWLSQNLHNPYPSQKTREDIATTSQSKRQVVDTWFIEVRRRIGWNDLRRTRFSNKKVNIVEAASCYFLSNGGGGLDTDVELEFAAIERKVQNMYRDRLSRSSLALELDDLAPQTTQDITTTPVASTSSSRPFVPITSPRSNPVFETTPVAGKKRRSSFSESEIIHKRARCAASSRQSPKPIKARKAVVEVDTPTPSPSYSSSRSSSPCSSGPSTPPPAYKRRLPGGDSNRTTKRARYHSPDEPTIVEAPVRSVEESASFEDWFSTYPSSDFDEAASPQVDIQVFDYSKMDLDSCIPTVPTKFHDSHTVGSFTPVTDRLSTTTQPHDLNGLFEVDEPAFGMTNSSITDVQTFCPGFDAVSQSSTSYAFDAGTEILNDQLSWFTQPPLLDCDRWLPTDHINNLSHSLDCQPPPPTDILLPTIRFDSEVPIDTHLRYGPPETKADKKRRLAEIQEEARRLQAEIASS